MKVSQMIVNFFPTASDVEDAPDTYDSSYTQFDHHYVYVRKKYV